MHGLFFTLTSPHPHLAVEVLLSKRGLLTLSPVVARGAAGLVLLWRRGLRAEAALIAALTVVEVGWHVFRPDYELALGGWVPGPRFLVPAPAVPRASRSHPSLRRAPATFAALAAISVGAMVVATSAEPLLSNDDTHHWISRIVDGTSRRPCSRSTGIGHGWLAILPFYASSPPPSPPLPR